MNENSKEILIDLLIKQGTEGLTDRERQQLDGLEAGSHDNSFAITTTAISLIDEKADEPMPMHLRANIRASAEKYFDEKEELLRPTTEVSVAPQTTRQSYLNWLGWAVATAACVALVANMYLRQVQPGPQVVYVTPTPETLTPAQERRRFVDSGVEMVKASVTNGPMKDMPEISGDVVWSDAKQEGYVRLRGLPTNDNTKQQYQLWIFEQNQSQKTPISGGVFDVNANGEVIIPIKAMLKANKPTMFAVTVEKPGGVMVTKGDTIAALGKVET